MSRAIVPPPWTVDALCAEIDHDLFFPVKSAGQMSAAEAKAVCRRCTVAAECLHYALSFDITGGDYGIWGGTSPRQRRALRRANTTDVA